MVAPCAAVPGRRRKAHTEAQCLVRTRGEDAIAGVVAGGRIAERRRARTDRPVVERRCAIEVVARRRRRGHVNGLDRERQRVAQGLRVGVRAGRGHRVAQLRGAVILHDDVVRDRVAGHQRTGRQDECVDLQVVEDDRAGREGRRGALLIGEERDRHHSRPDARDEQDAEDEIGEQSATSTASWDDLSMVHGWFPPLWTWGSPSGLVVAAYRRRYAHAGPVRSGPATTTPRERGRCGSHSA